MTVFLPFSVPTDLRTTGTWTQHDNEQLRQMIIQLDGLFDAVTLNDLAYLLPAHVTVISKSK